ncbi:carbohydrate ABC transporter permease [Paenibacillus alba]|uniref:Carbohydrate ABC transporter permease n=1 Tax=Paenibacillus alba TaxID=1197127 RepID=A0ABU6G6I5_9BACL|nr:carbohydrate ABC transporter permease [Paenibacillus alba]MEC0229561.1 carbohydrate ABC transporter permease [Paenibacillus alba]NQX71825.1 carbohydrate ABC transporter permease [Paenibacillus alba]
MPSTQPTKLRNIHRLPLAWNALLHVIAGAFAAACVFPFLFVVLISFTDESTLAQFGYRIFPEKWSLHAYSYIFKTGDQLFHSYGITLFVTVAGTAITVIMTTLYAYALSRKSFAYRKFFTFLAFFTMLFGGGLVPTYIITAQLLHLKDTIWALILPMALNAYNIVILRTFFQTMIPDPIIESGKIDGAGELRILFNLVLPLALPGLATIALFSTLGYWNDWFNALLYIDSNRLVPLQSLLMRIETSMQFIIQNSAMLNSGQSKEMLRSLPQETSRMAMVVLATGPIVLAYPFFQRYFVEGLTIGAVKD